MPSVLNIFSKYIHWFYFGTRKKHVECIVFCWNLCAAIACSNLTISVYLIKIKYKVIWVCINFKPKEFLLEEMC